MKNFFKLKAMLRIAGIIAFVAVIGFGMVACDNGDDNGGSGGGGNSPFIGTWTGTGITLVCTETTWVFTDVETGTFSGTYTYSGNVASFFVASVGVGSATVSGNTMNGNVQGYGAFTVTK